MKPLTITRRMNGKMDGMYALNTSPSNNPFCQAMMQRSDLICSHCYSPKTEKRYKQTKPAWVRNGNILSSRLLKDDEINLIKGRDVFRFDAHGELINRTHYLNLVKFAEINESVNFALWTKRPDIVHDGGIVKLANMIYVYSTPKLNVLKPKVPKDFHRVFSVYTPDFIEENNIMINCGDKHCADCRTCYEFNNVVFINEELKRGT